MINKFRDEMPQPIVGVGHSMGAGQLSVSSIRRTNLMSISLTFLQRSTVSPSSPFIHFTEPCGACHFSRHIYGQRPLVGSHIAEKTRRLEVQSRGYRKSKDYA